MASKKFIVGVASAVVMFASGAQAADMPPRFELPTPPPIYRAPTITDDSSGWYLRGDIGYRLNMMDRAAAPAGFTDPSSNSIGNGMTYGGGAGFKAGWIRADLTVDYAPTVNYSGTVFTANDINAQISSITGLFNLYFDLGTWYGITPYVGGGLGTSYLSTSNYASLVVPPLGVVASNSRWNLAWAATAGASYSFTRNLLLDAGYRYLSLGYGVTASDAIGRSTTFRGLAAHEFRVGIRWMFNDPYPVQ